MSPWTNNETNGNRDVDNTIAEDNSDAKSPQISTPKVDIEGTTTSLYQELLNRGYEFVVCHSTINKKGATVEDRQPNEQIYTQKNYLKLGLTNYYSGIVFPPISKFQEATGDVKVSFDWCTVRQGSGVWDTTQLVVIVKNGDDEKQFLVDPLSIADGEAYKWYPTQVTLTGAAITKDTRIIIRNIDEQWPAQAEKGGSNWTLRWFIDNIKVYSADGGSGVAGIEAEENAPVEYYNLQGIRVADPENGLYIVKQGNKVTKRVIK